MIKKESTESYQSLLKATTFGSNMVSGNVDGKLLKDTNKTKQTCKNSAYSFICLLPDTYNVRSRNVIIC